MDDSQTSGTGNVQEKNYMNVLHERYLRDLDLIGHNLDSFDQGINQLIHVLNGREWIQLSKTEDELSYRIKISNVCLLNPQIHDDVTYNTGVLEPKDCIERKMSYEGKFRGTVEISMEGNHQPRLRSSLPPVEVDFMYIPIPVGSRFCNTFDRPMDPDVYTLRGCFIIKGQKKNIISFETPALNNPIFMHSNDDGYFYEVRAHSSSVVSFDVTSTVYANIIKMKKRVLLFQSRSFKMNSSKGITLVNVLTNLGLTTAEAIRNALLGESPDPELEDALEMTLSNSDDFPIPDTFEEIRARFGQAPTSLGSHLGRRNIQTYSLPKQDEWAASIIEREILPFCGDNNAAKIVLLCTMARRVALANYRAERGIPVDLDNRDDLCNKYIKGYGDLVQELVLEGMKMIREKVNKEIRKTENSQRPKTALTANTFPGIVSLPWLNVECMKTIANGQISSKPRGKSGANKGQRRTGLTQNFGGLNIMYDISSLRNFKNPINKQSKSESIRQIQASSFGYYCPTETREGQDVGLDKALSLQATVSLAGSYETIETIIEQFTECEIRPISIDYLHQCESTSVIYLNGMPLYQFSKEYVSSFCEYFRNYRRNGLIDLHASIYEKENRDISIHFNSGRLTATYFIVESGRVFVLERIQKGLEFRALATNDTDRQTAEQLLNFDFMDLYGPVEGYFNGVPFKFPAAAEYVDVFERKNILLAETLQNIQPGTTHLMIHPSLILGSSAAEVPFPDHNQSPRNAYQCGMGKQSIAGRPLVTINSNHTPPYLLYPQTPLVQTKYTKMILDKHPCPAGFNGIVAIMSRGRNQEDAIILNRDSLQRGMGVTLHEQLYSDCAKNTGLHYESGLSQAEKFAFPDADKVCNGFNTRYVYVHLFLFLCFRKCF